MRKGLGKGLSQLIGEQATGGVEEIAISSIVPNPRQPRKHFSEESLQELAQSIASVGVIQPLVVRPLDQNRYELIAGERRLRAAQIAGLKIIPVVIRSASQMESLQLALIENLQREDIGAIESAEAFKMLISEFNLTQDEVAKQVGKSRSSVANTLRLLKLPDVILNALANGEISEGHARAILQFDTETEQLMVFKRIIEKNLSVRDVERLAQGKRIDSESKAEKLKLPQTQLERQLSEYFGTPVRVQKSGGKGKIEIEFYSEDDLDRIIEKFSI